MMSSYAGHTTTENSVDACPKTFPMSAGQRVRRLRRRPWRSLLQSALSLSAFAEFLEQWKASRPRRYLFGAMPWSGLAAGTGLLLTSLLLRNVQHYEHNYEQLLEQAQRAGQVSLQLQCLEALADLNSENARRTMELGVLLTRQGNRNRGVALIRKAADGGGTGLADAHVWLARDMLRQGDRSDGVPAEVERHLQAAMTLSPAASETHLLMAEHYESVGEAFLANKYRLSAARLDPRLYPAALTGLPIDPQAAAVNSNLRKEAITTLENQLSLTPTDARLRTALAEVLMLNQQLDEAGRVLNEAVEADDPQWIQRALSRWNVAQAVALMNASPLNHEACFPFLKAALRQDPQNAGAIRLAEELARSGMIWPPETFDSAIRVVGETLEKFPESDSVRIDLCQLLNLAGRHVEAAEFLAPLQHTNASLKLMLVKTLMQAGDLQGGTRCGESLLTTLATTPASTSRVLLTAECLLLLNRAEEAVKLLRQHGQSIAPKEVPEPLTVLYARACLAAAANKLQRRNTSDAAETPVVSAGIIKNEDENDPVFLLFVALACDATRYQALDHLTALTLGTGAEARQAETVLQTLRASGKFANEILSLTGINAIRSERYDIAVTALEQARDCAEHEDPRILNNLALAMIRRDSGEGEQALETINQALVMLPGHPDLLSTRGEIHVARHQWKHALQDLTTALDLRPDNAPIHRLLEQTCTGLNAERQALIHRQIAERLEGHGRADAMSAN